MKILGICGRSGSGKGYVSRVFSSFGGLHIDTDKIYHDLLLPCGGVPSELGMKLASEFGNEIISADNSIDRKVLGKIVFSDKEKLERLNIISHAAILKKVKSVLAKSNEPFAVVDAPLLFESGFDRFCDFTVCVIADDAVCVKRITERDKISVDEAQKRLSFQLNSDILKEKCDFTVYNSDSSDLKEQIHKILIEIGIM